MTRRSASIWLFFNIGRLVPGLIVRDGVDNQSTYPVHHAKIRMGRLAKDFHGKYRVHNRNARNTPETLADTCITNYGLMQDIQNFQQLRGKFYCCDPDNKKNSPICKGVHTGMQYCDNFFPGLYNGVSGVSWEAWTDTLYSSKEQSKNKIKWKQENLRDAFPYPDPERYLKPECITDHKNRFSDYPGAYFNAGPYIWFGMNSQEGGFGGTWGPPSPRRTDGAAPTKNLFVMPQKKVFDLSEVFVNVVNATPSLRKIDSIKRVVAEQIAVPTPATDELQFVAFYENSGDKCVIPTGRESMASPEWIPGGYTGGGIPEAVCEQAKFDEYVMALVGYEGQVCTRVTRSDTDERNMTFEWPDSADKPRDKTNGLTEVMVKYCTKLAELSGLDPPESWEDIPKVQSDVIIERVREIERNAK